MAEIIWTSQQNKAIRHFCDKLLVSAAAGSGKTSVLVERVLQRILEPENDYDIDDFLIVTFSQAAATDMRRKVIDRITGAIADNPARGKLVRQLSLIDNAAIMTLHSFCLEVIRNNFNLTDLDPGFRISDESEAALIKSDAVDALFDEIYERDEFDAGFKKLNDWYGSGKDEEKLKEFLLGIYKKIESQPYPLEWVDEKVAEFADSGGKAAFGGSVAPWWKTAILRRVTESVGHMSAEMRKALAIVSDNPAFAPNVEIYTKDCAMLFDLHAKLRENVLEWDFLSGIFENAVFCDRVKPVPGADANRKDLVDSIRNDCKDKIKDIKEKIVSIRESDIAADSAMIHEVFLKISQVLKRFDVLYTKMKKDRAVIDFNDIEHYCLKILRGDSGEPSPVAVEYAKRFKEIIIDEYQDINLTQEAILNSMKTKIFMVGDVKQSIYRFRDACPDMFMEKYHAYSDELQDGSNENKILLNSNFRSRREIIDVVNHIFKNIMSESAGEIDYSKSEELVYGADYDDKQVPVELHIIDYESMKVIMDDNPGKMAIEAKYIASCIKEMMKSDSDIKFKDIVILMRATKGKNDILQKEFAAADIPSYVDDAKGFFKSVEVQIMMSLLQIIDNPLQDIPLLAVLRSPVGRFTSEELSEIRINSGESRFYGSMLVYPVGNPDLKSKVDDFLNDLGRWRELSRKIPVDELIWLLYDETLYYDYAGAMNAGEQRQGNLQILFEKAVQFEKTSYKGLFNFNRFINRVKEGNEDFGSARMLSEKDDVVRIMSIHKAKGLEFRVVILADCCKKFNLRDTADNVLIHRDFGFGPEIVDIERKVKYPSVQKLAIKDIIRTENISEEMRILYVGLTRAKERLIITGLCDKFGNKKAKWFEGSSVSKAAGATSFMEWICMGIADHKDAQALRGEPQPDRRDESLKIIIKNSDDYSETIEEMKSFELEAPGTEDRENDPEYAEIVRRLEWKYPHAASVKLPVKISVSEYNKRLGTDENKDDISTYRNPVQIVRSPSFIEVGTGEIAVRLGILTHYIMRMLDLNRPQIDETYVDAFKTSMIEKGIMTQDESITIKSAEIAGYFATPIGRRMKNATRVYREIPFVLAAEAKQLYGQVYDAGAASEEMILVQGIIDCYFEDESGSVLLDYKTDSVREFDENILRIRYGAQLNLYKQALKEKNGIDPGETYIYMFKNGRFVNL